MANANKVDLLIKEFPEVAEELLNSYSAWLNTKGYLDSDYYTEEPKAVSAYLEEVKKRPMRLV